MKIFGATATSLTWATLTILIPLSLLFGLTFIGMFYLGVFLFGTSLYGLTLPYKKILNLPRDKYGNIAPQPKPLFVKKYNTIMEMNQLSSIRYKVDIRYSFLGFHILTKRAKFVRPDRCYHGDDHALRDWTDNFDDVVNLKRTLDETYFRNTYKKIV